MKFSDEMLMAYADGELDLVARAEIESAMADDAAIARIIERHRALRSRVQAAYGGVLGEPVPAQLSSLVAPPVPAPVVELATRRAAEAAKPARSWPMPQWMAMAAAVTLGLFIGVFALRGPEAPYEQSANGLLARGDLAWALNGQLASDAGTGAVRIGMSFRDRGGNYCRTFRLQQEATLAGLACHAGEDWQVKVLAAAAPEAGELRGAASMPMAVLHAVDAEIDGEPLDAPSETGARDAGWPPVSQPVEE
jgi:anti-sigma factor RsiW